MKLLAFGPAKQTNPRTAGEWHQPTANQERTKKGEARERRFLNPTPHRLGRDLLLSVRKAVGVFGPKYRATSAPHGPRSFYAVVGRARAICERGSQ